MHVDGKRRILHSVDVMYTGCTVEAWQRLIATMNVDYVEISVGSFYGLIDEFLDNDSVT